MYKIFLSGKLMLEIVEIKEGVYFLLFKPTWLQGRKGWG